MQNGAFYELTVFLCAMAAGILTGFIYDLFRIKRKVIKTRSVFVHLEDILFWAAASIVLFLTAYMVSSGETRPYYYLGVITGAALYFALLSKLVMKVFITLLQLLAWPVAQMIKLLTPPFNALMRLFGGMAGRAGKSVAQKTYRSWVGMQRFKHTLTKK